MAATDGTKKTETEERKMKRILVSVIAVLCLVAGTARAYEMDDKIGAEIVKISAGDQGVYGAAKWLHEQNLLPAGMSVAEAYVKICRKNFETLADCEEASLKFQPGQTLKIFAPVIARAIYDKRLTKSLKEEVAVKDQQIVALDAMVMTATAKAEKAEAMLKSVAVEAQRIKAEIEELREEKVAFVRQNKELTARLGASKRAFDLLLARARATAKVRAKIVDRIREPLRPAPKQSYIHKQKRGGGGTYKVLN